MSKTVIALICPRHGFSLGDHCSQCSQDNEHKETLNINTDNWVVGDYEHIDPKGPIHIESKAQLKEECLRRGLLAKSLMKPKNQGAGYEMR